MSDDHLHSIIADYGDACAEMQAELDRLRAELAAMSEAYNKRLAEALHFEHQCELGSAELAAMKRADWEVAYIKDDDLDKEIEALRKRFDDAVEAIDLKDKELIQERGVSRDLRKRVGELENKNSYNLQIVREATALAKRAEAERDALHLFSGAQAAVIKEMREALELVLKYEYEWLVPSSLADVARAALAPPPAGREERHEMTSIGDKEPDADPAGREG